jgi:hypothetical protein
MLYTSITKHKMSNQPLQLLPWLVEEVVLVVLLRTLLSVHVYDIWC